MHLTRLDISGFKSFAKKTFFDFTSSVVAIVGPNGSGKCVTGDTLVRRRAKNSWEDVPITRIHANDEVLSFDELQKKFIGARVKRRIDSGMKPVLKLVTEDGRSIRTSAEHPYLVQNTARHAARHTSPVTGAAWVAASDIQTGDRIAVPKPRLGVFVDGSNIFYSEKRAGWRIDYARLREYLSKDFDTRFINYYTALPKEGDEPARRKKLAYLRKIEHAVHVITKPLKYVLPRGKTHETEDAQRERKGDCDVDIAVDVMNALSELDAVLVLSGDSDFVSLRDDIVKKGKKICFIAHRDNLAHELKQGKYMTLNSLRSFLEHDSKITTPAKGGGTLVSLLYPNSGGVSNDLGDALWVSVRSVVPIPEEHVYDLEIDRTHNFVGNGIIAHNSNVAEAVRFVLGEQSMKSMRGKRGEDLIWNGSASSPRANRGAVGIVFNNRSRFLNIDFDEVTVERIVSRDGVNEYRLNGSTVRLKDILELLAGANIGQTGHHIISQGEADKVLSASPRERREMLEDALGLKVYQYKLVESERKLGKTEENMRQVTALRREIAPHLRFLKKQVEKVEKAQALKEAAVLRFKTYFKREETYLTVEKVRLEGDLKNNKATLNEIGKKVADAKQALKGAAEDKRGNTILDLSKALDDARIARADAARRAARIEGQIEAMEKTAAKASVSATDVSHLVEEGEAAAAKFASGKPEEALAFLKSLLEKLKTLVTSARSGSGDMGTLMAERDELMRAEKESEKRERELEASLEKIRTELDALRVEEREKERTLFELAAEEREVKHAINLLDGEMERLSLLEAEFKRDIAEAIPLIGREIASYASVGVDAGSRDEQEREKRELEKIKIRLEEMGLAGGEDMMKEYKEATEREEFLERELQDLEAAAASLKTLIADLEKELAVKFKSGIDAINAEFTKLFALMFDGGSAYLTRVQEPVKKAAKVLDFEQYEEAVEAEDEDPEKASDEGEFVEGIDIALSIPRKRVKSLVMLSGGERALTSIALIFAMSAVNPPPFLILDETDAALDESNSRRYGDMIEALSKKSQLILITHNRETMSRAGILYGVTMGNDGVSKVLSVKLEEAVKVAK